MNKYDLISMILKKFWYFRFLNVQKSMRKQSQVKGRKSPRKMTKEPSLPILQRIESEIIPQRTHKRLNLHFRSRTRHFQQQLTQNFNNQMLTPAVFLPRIDEHSERAYQQPKKTGLDTLQEHLHKMLLKNLKQCRQTKQMKSLEHDIDKKRLNFKEKEDECKKQSQKNRFQQLKVKLNELYGQLAVEQNKLKIQYTLEDKMERRLNGFFDKMSRRFQKTTTVDVSQNTEQPVQTTKEQDKIKKQPQSNQRKRKILSKFRVAAYAVYFTLVFPKYVQKFHSIRKLDFIKKITQQKCVQQSIQGCYKLLELLKLKSFWKQLQNKSKDISSDAVSVTISQLDRSSEPLTYNFKVENINSLLAFVLSNILTAIRNGKIDDLIKNTVLIIKNKSLIADYIFLESELFDINIDQKMLINLTPSQEKVLLTNFLLIKLIAFSFMMNNNLISENQTKYIFNKKSPNKYENLTFSISKQLLICGIYLIHLCNNLNRSLHQEEKILKGKIQCLSPQKMPLPMPGLEYKSNLTFSKSQIQQKRTSIEDDIQIFNAQLNGICVKNIKNLSALLRLIENNKQETHLMALISDIQNQVYNKSVSLKKELYQEYKNKALIQKQMKQPINEIHSQRTQQQKALIQCYRNNFKARRQRQRQAKQKVSIQKQIITERQSQKAQQIEQIFNKTQNSMSKSSRSVIKA